MPAAVAALVLLVSMLAATPAHAAVEWNASLPAATATAQKGNKPILIEFWATWCPSCKLMDEQVYADARVSRAMTRFVPVRIDVDRNANIASRYDVAGTPTHVLTDSFGNELFRFGTLTTPQEMLDLLEDLPSDATTFNTLGAALAANKDDFGALEGMGRALRAARLYRPSNDYYARALRSGGARANPAARPSIHQAIGRHPRQVREVAPASSTLDS
jgi:thiol-disulfide isomerase/thioredoxin